ncbi:MAG: glycosyltransferase family 39 protein, partial [Chloroflexota bacterium]
MKRDSLARLGAPLAILLLAAFLRLYRLANVPFGWHPDEATKALLARDVLAGKYHPVFFSAFTGREALFVYLEALLFALLGEGIFVGRLLSAFVGILTVALTYATAREMFSRRIGLLAAAFLAVSLWHLIASRNGYRAVIQPFIQLFAI